MGFSLKKIFGGGKGKVHTPIEAKESGRSKQLVDITEILSEGEIEGLVDGMKSVFLIIPLCKIKTGRLILIMFNWTVVLGLKNKIYLMDLIHHKKKSL